jgi:PAH dioxygenase large subunit
MTDRSSLSERPKWVDVERGLVSREIFVDENVFRREQDRIFTRTWMYLAHESEIPARGDYLTRALGGVPVILIRDDDSRIHVLMNSCRHRGAKLCRAESGNARHLVCPYHGWTYGRDGKLVTTTFDQHFPEGTDFKALGLVRVPRVEMFKGLIFACWDADVVSLTEYLGEFAWYLEPFFARTPQGMEVLAPPQRWRAKANWKIGALNFVGDSQHILTTHVGPLTLDPVRAARAGFATAGENSFQIVTDYGHGCTLTYLAPGLPADAYQTHPPALESQYAKTLGPDQKDMLHHLRVIVGTIFPNLSFIETQVGSAEKAVILRIWQPISGTEMEVLSWVLAEREASREYKHAVLTKGFRNFGAAGVFEQDDMEIWASATQASNNPIAQQYPYSFHTALPYLRRPATDHKGPGRAFRPPESEVAQLEFMRRWDQMMATN